MVVDETLQSHANRRLRLFASQFDQQAVLQLEQPGQARRKGKLGRLPTNRLQELGELVVPP